MTVDSLFLERLRMTSVENFPDGFIDDNAEKLTVFAQGICADLRRGVPVSDELRYLPEHGGLPGPGAGDLGKQSADVFTAATSTYCPEALASP